MRCFHSLGRSVLSMLQRKTENETQGNGHKEEDDDAQRDQKDVVLLLAAAFLAFSQPRILVYRDCDP